MRRGPIWLCVGTARSPHQCQMSSPDLGECSGHALMGNLSNDHWPRGWFELVQDKGNRRVGTYLNQRRAGNEVITKECRQYSVQIPRPNVRILASRSMGRSRSNLAALRICIAGSPMHLCKHWNPSRPELTFGRHREQTAYTGTPSLWLTLRVFARMEHKKRAQKMPRRELESHMCVIKDTRRRECEFYVAYI